MNRGQSCVLANQGRVVEAKVRNERSLGPSDLRKDEVRKCPRAIQTGLPVDSWEIFRVFFRICVFIYCHPNSSADFAPSHVENIHICHRISVGEIRDAMRGCYGVSVPVSSGATSA